jgi:peptidoglycan/xylan/chitin deacetylase (PgdA/CDA1 family)
VFSRHGAKPALAVISDRVTHIYHNGVQIDKTQASFICKAAGWDIVSHTATHRIPDGQKPSQYIQFYTGDIYSTDLINGDGTILVFPGGQTNPYMNDVMEYLGFKLGILTNSGTDKANLRRNRFNIYRVNISRIIYANGNPIPYDTVFMDSII